jgi:VCBS repeat-containing protein
MTYSIVGQATKGTADVIAGELRYVPNPNENGADSFTYRAGDGGLVSSAATVSVTITAVNDTPVCSDVALTTSEDVANERDPACSDIDGDGLTYSVVSQGTKGTASIASGKLRFVPSLNATGDDSFTYRAGDGAAVSAPATVSVTITPVNDAPSCQGSSLALDEDGSGSLTPVCSDPEGDAVTLEIVDQAAKGTASVDASLLRYVPVANANGSDSFTYRGRDANGAAGAAATVAVTIRPVNDAPACANLSLTTAEDVAGEVAPVCTEIDGDTLTYSTVSAAANGVASVVNGKLRYVPSPSFNGTDSFTYQAHDGTAASEAAVVSVTVTPVNDAPVAQDLTATTTEDSGKVLALSASDVDGDALTYSIVSGPAHGTLSGTAPNLTYTPDANYNGSDSFSYRASDSATGSNTATVELTVTAVNDAPVANDVTATTAEDTAKTVALVASDVDGDVLTYTIVTPPAHGTLSGTGASRTYTPDANFHGVDSFTYLVSDGSSVQSGVATVEVTVSPANDAPVAQDLSATTAEDTAKGLLLTATDVDGDGLTYTVVSGPTHGTLSGSGANLTYTPDANYHGSDSFSYRASDSATGSNTATVELTVTAVNDAPVANDVTATTAEDTTKSVALVASDVDGDALAYSIVAAPAHGTLSGTGANRTYTPDANYHGPDSFTYKATDGSGADSSVATVGLTISAVNDAPVCPPLSMNLDEDATAAITPVCTDVEGDAVTLEIASQGTKGTASLAGGDLRYAASPNANGTDGFTYRGRDGSAAGAAAAVSVTINPINDAPVAQGQSVSTLEDTAKALTLGATDADGDALTFTIVSGPANGTLTGTGADRVYTPAANFFGDDSFTFKASDGVLETDVVTVTIAVTQANDPPSAGDVSESTLEDTAKVITLSGTDADGNPITFEIVSGPVHGTLTGEGGTRTYVPAPNYSGSDSFTYRVVDGFADSEPATVALTIVPVNDAPSCQNRTLTTDEDVTAEVDPSCTDVDSASLTYEIAAQGSKGTASTVGGRLRYSPARNANGSDSFTYRASDGSATSPAATVSATIQPRNDAPACSALSVTIDEDTDGFLAPACSDPEGDAATVSIVSQPQNGTVSFSGGQFRYIPFVDFHGSDSFTYRASDGSLAGAPATVSVTVRSVNDEPEAVPVDTTTDKGVARVVTLTGFDYDNDPLTFRIVSLPANGTLRAGPNASDHAITAAELPYALAGTDSVQIRYEPATGYTGVNTFEFRAHDGAAAGLPAEVRISVVGTNTAPACSNKTLTVDEDVELWDAVACSDPDNDPLTFTRTGPSHGQVTIFDNGSFNYVPDPNYNGTDSFTVQARDPSGRTSAVATITIAVASVNDAPTCRSFTLVTTEDTPGLRFPDCDDADGQALTYTIVGQGTKGTASVEEDGRFRYAPNANENGADSFTFAVSDGIITTSGQTAEVSITAVNDAPVCRAVGLTTPRETAGTIFPDCEDADGNTLTYEIVSAPANGTASVSGPQLSYSPAAGYTGSDSFTYRASDGTLFSAAATVSVTVTP